MEYLIWSIEHEGWWRPDECGYTAVHTEAGRYTQARADEIVRRARGNECRVPALSVGLTPHESTRSCGCDPGARYLCAQHQVETENRYLLSAQGDTLIFQRPPGRLTHEEALGVAAWLVMMVGDEDRWQQVRDAVQGT